MKKTSRFSWLRHSAVALTLTGTMLLGMFPVSAAPSNADHTDTQISSAVETVYVDTYTGNQREINFNDHWRFNLGEANNAQDVTFNDSEWQNVNLPHDYSIEQKYTTAGEAESGYLPGGVGWYRKTFQIDPTWKTEKRLSVNFDGVYMNAEVYLNGHLLGSHPYGYTAFSFELPEEHLVAGQNVLAVKVNNQLPSSRWYSGSGIYRDVTLVVTDRVHVAPNGVTVTTPDAETKSGKVHVQTVVTNDGTEAANGLTVTTSVMKKGSETVLTTVDTPVTFADKTATVETDLTVSNPELWNAWSEGPANLYVVKTEVKKDGKVLDTVENEFGFRYFNFDMEKGFSLNGKNMKLKGVCMHHDQGALGSEAWADAIRRQVKILKEMGCNAIRVTHNPAAKVLIDICNEEGMLIIEEAFDTWSTSKNGNSNDYGRHFKETIGQNSIEGGKADMTWAEFDIKSMVSRDKNDPCVIMWSLGNEIFEGGAGANDYPTLAENLIRWVGQVDKTRYVTIGDNKKDSGSGNPGRVNAKIADAKNIGGVRGGVVGFNYASEGQVQAGHNKGWLMYGSETASAVNSRGVYNVKGSQQRNKQQDLTSYDKSRVNWGAVASDAWWRTINHDYDAGEFVWTGFDYIGEPTPCNGTGPGVSPYYSGPFETAPKSSYFGIIDTTGFPKDSFYLYQSLWNNKVHTLHVLPTWNEEDLPKNHSTVEVVVYSDAPVIRLYLNGTEIGAAKAKTVNTDVHSYQTYEACALREGSSNVFQSANGHQSLYATFNVPYAAGTLEAKAFENETSTTPMTGTKGRSMVKTTSAASQLKMTVDADKQTIPADGKSLSYITIDVLDAAGNMVNGAEPEISLSISGNGKIVGVDNGRQADHTSYQSTTWKAAHGKLLVIVQSTEQAGSFTVTAKSNVGSTSATVQTTPVSADSTAKKPVSLTYAKNYYVKTGNAPVLPETIQVNFSDGSKEQAAVKWDLSSQTGDSYVVPGTLELADGTKLIASVNVTMIGDVVCLKNYSTAVMKGSTSANLPNSLLAVMPNGEVSKISIPVTWNIKNLNLNQIGTYTVTGTANVFGKILNPIATIRVANGSVTPVGNVANAASKLYLNGKSDAGLEVVRDGKKTSDSAAWAGPGDVQFFYDTAQNLIKVVLYTKGTTEAPEISWSADGKVWTPVEVEASAEQNGDMTVYTYELGMISSENLQIKCAAGTSLVEAELHIGTPTFPVGSEAALSSLEVGGVTATDGALQNGEFNVTGNVTAADVKAVGKDNAAVTILPEMDNTVKILLESEDHTKTGTFLIHGNSSGINAPAADDASYDYPYNKTTAAAPSYHGGSGNEGGPALAVDNNADTYWHSRWGTSGEGETDLSSHPEHRYIELTLDETAELIALRYLPRSGDYPNGRVLDYHVEIQNEDGTWETVSRGTWENNSGWKIAKFDKAVQTKCVRLYGDRTWSDKGDNKYMSVAEIRVCTKEQAPVEPVVTYARVEDYETMKTNAKSNTGKGTNKWGDGIVDFAFDGNSGNGTIWSQNYENSDEYDAQTKTGGTTALPTAEAPIWIQTGFDESKTISKIVLVNKKKDPAYTNNMKTVKVYVADTEADLEKEENLVGTYTFTSGVGTDDTIILENSKAGRFIRLAATEAKRTSGASLNLSLVEAELYEIQKEVPETPVYTVTFVMDDATYTARVKDGEAIGANLPANPTKAGYEFAGWTDAQNQPVDEKTIVTGNMVITAQWTEKPDVVVHTVTIRVDDQETTKQVEDGDPIGSVLPTDLTKEGYTFAGWKDADGNDVTAETPVTGDMTVIAQWTKDETPVDPEPPVDPDIPPYIPPVRPTEPTKPTKPVVKPELPFTDVSKNDWFYDSVYSAWENYLLDGMTATEFAPDSTLTVAQTIKLAAALHEREKLGKVTLTNGAEQWYSTYVSYAISNDIIEKSYADYTPAQMNAPVSRREFVKILHGALDSYAEKNTVADNAIPDVKMADKNAAEIYEFYRAGILTGSDAQGTFLPETTIKRSEAAAILVRMFDVTERQSITLR